MAVHNPVKSALLVKVALIWSKDESTQVTMQTDRNQSINSVFIIYQAHKKIKQTNNFNSTNKGSNWSIATGSCEGTSQLSSQTASYFI